MDFSGKEKKNIGVDDIKVKKHNEDRDLIVHTHPSPFFLPLVPASYKASNPNVEQLKLKLISRIGMEILLQFSDELSLHSLESKHGSLVNCMSISSDTVKPSQVITLKKQKIWQLSNLLSEIGEKL